jgi:chromosome condensin MukBEF MukE localization factor
LLSAGLVLGGAVLVSRPRARDAVDRFRRDVRDGMDAREAQLREVLALDTHLTLPGERVNDARAIEGR